MIRIAHNLAARRLAVVGLAAVLLSSCQGQESGTPPDPRGIEGTGGTQPPPSYTVGGSVTGLVGSGLVLQDNGGNNLAITSNGSFVFSTAVASGSAYAVTIKTQPTNPAQTCVLTVGTGTITDANVPNVVATCTISPGRFAYVSGGLGVYCYAIDALSGALTALAGSPCDTGDRVGVASDPSGKFVYSTLNIIDNSTAPPSIINSDATAYTINSSTGSLVTVAGSPYVGGGDGCVDITVDPSGKFVYMANYAGRNNSGASISAFAINSVTGGLTAVPGSPFPSRRQFLRTITLERTRSPLTRRASSFM
jgi:6-phosphogluconolactonase